MYVVHDSAALLDVVMNRHSVSQLKTTKRLLLADVEEYGAVSRTPKQVLMGCLCLCAKAGHDEDLCKCML